MNTATQFKIGDKIERITGDKRNRGEVIEIDEMNDRLRINWTHRQGYETEMVNKHSYRTRTVWEGIFEPYTTKQPRTWAAAKSLKVVA